MKAVVPGKGWCTVHTGTGITSTYGVLGPLAEGDYLRRLTVMIMSNEADGGRFAATIGASGEGSLASYQAGVPLIQRSNVTSGIIPCFYWHSGAGVPAWFWIPVGIVGSVGSRYVVFAWNNLSETASVSILVGGEVLRFGKAAGEEGEE